VRRSGAACVSHLLGVNSNGIERMPAKRGRYVNSPHDDLTAYNQRTELTKAPETGLLAGILHIGPMNQAVMLTGYISPSETFIDIPNQDVVYGLGWLSIAKERVVIQSYKRKA
jgi:hypothetical protein